MSAEIQTADHLLRARDVGRCELVRGEFRPLIPPGFEHGRVAMRLSLLLGRHVEDHALGTALAAETGFWIARNPDTVRAPDIAFLSAGRAPGPASGYYEGAPDLVVEVRSPDDSARKVRNKTTEWLAAGAQVVWNVDPLARTVSVQEASQREGATNARLLRNADLLSCASLLPGFAVPVNTIFG